jgi:hypothetical protein
MKRIFRIGTLVLAVVSMASCVLGIETNKIPVNIGFMPVIGHDTRADIEESIPFPEDRDFRVWATNSYDGSMVLNNESISYTSEGWLASQMWPEAELSFTAYWPTDLNPEFDRESGVIIRGFNTNEDKRDLLVARTKAEYDADSLVTLGFDHLLSRIDFRVMHSLEDGIEVVIEKIEMVGYGFTGDYNTHGDGKWRVDSQKDSHVIYDAAGGEGWNLTKNAEYIGDDFYAIPQLCLADVVVDCRVRVGNGGWVPDQLSVGNLRTDWQSGKQYTYTLNLTDTRLVYTTGISNWNNRE